LREGYPSRTAAFNAAFRAAESAKASHVRLIDDPYARHFLPTDLRLLVGISRLPFAGPALERVVDARWPGLRSSLIARTRLIDDWLSDAVGPQIRQIVVLGAGYDSRAWRLPFLAPVRIYEVDHPATSGAKQRRLARMGADLSHMRFVSVDFGRQTVEEGLTETDFEPSSAAVVLWDGVSNYLERQAVDAIVGWVGGLAPGGHFIFTYVHSGVFDGGALFADAAAITRTHRRAGEPWTFGMLPEAVADYLHKRGLRLVSDLGADEYRRKVIGPSAAKIRGYSFYHVARAEIIGPNPRTAR
jgi:methyltransferase (TIGR00027 family)